MSVTVDSSTAVISISDLVCSGSSVANVVLLMICFRGFFSVSLEELSDWCRVVFMFYVSVFYTGELPVLHCAQNTGVALELFNVLFKLCALLYGHTCTGIQPMPVL